MAYKSLEGRFSTAFLKFGSISLLSGLGLALSCDLDWPAFVSHVKQLNAEADGNTQHNILYIMQRAHSM